MTQSEATTARPNPMGVDRFEFIEFAATDAGVLHDLFTRLGFTAVARHKSRDVTLYRQGDINFLVNAMSDSFASEFAAQHGPCCTGFALRVTDGAKAQAAALERGAKPLDPAGGLALDLPCISGIGGSVLYLTSGLDELEAELDFDPAVERHPKGVGLSFVDHLTHNVYNGNMGEWADFYSKLFGFYEVKYFDIKGQQTGLRSQAMTAPNGNISIPINESEDPKSQINEYLDEYKGEGVQHIALYSDNIYESVEALHGNNIQFLDTPDTYFDVIDHRIPGHGEDVARMRKNKILIDADPNQTDRQLLQIFTQTNIGPIFFEIIQRKGNDGFGEGNFQALFEAIERDQEKRGVL
ncbi:MAG: 4-hydroxyphenylpyruvate dioxygenase [Pseudomonadota bacterium]